METQLVRWMGSSLGVLLAGGRSRRMGGGDKALALLGGASLARRCIDRLRGQVDRILLNSNGSSDSFRDLNVEVRGDVIANFQGPLAGLLTGLEWAREIDGDDAWVLSAAVDCPFFPKDLGARLAEGVENQHASGQLASMAVARSGGRLHPVFGLWSVGLIGSLRAVLETTARRKMLDFIAPFNPAIVDWPIEPFDPFSNINTPDDLRELASQAELGLRS